MKVSQDVMQVLSAARVEGSQLFLVGALPRPLYMATDKVLQAAGGKWNKKAKAHVFEADAAERIDQIIVTGGIEIPKDEFEYFPTPAPLVERMLELADLRPCMTVLEPSAGQGAIALPAARAGCVVDCMELMVANSLELAKFQELRSVAPVDFLTVDAVPVYDRVLMNPPFARRADIKHVLHAFKFLKPGGRLVAIMSAGVAFREDKLGCAFRTILFANGGTMEPNPEGSFKASGTMVNTVMVVMDAEP